MIGLAHAAVRAVRARGVLCGCRRNGCQDHHRRSESDPGSEQHQSAANRRLVLVGHAEQPPDAEHQRAFRGPERWLELAFAPRRQRQQRLGVRRRFPRNRDGGVVAAVLALLADAPRDPPDGRMEEQQRFGDRLQQVDRVIAAADVRELVSEERFDLGGGHVRHRGERQDDQGLQPADQDRRVDHRRLDDPERHADAQAAGETSGGQLPGGEGCRDGRGAQAMDAPASGGEPGDERRHACQPDPHDDRQQLARARRPDGLTRGGRQRSLGADRRLDRRPEAACRRQLISGQEGGMAGERAPDGGRGGRRQHRREAEAGDRVADVGRRAAARSERGRRGEGEQRALPDEMDQRPAGYFDPRAHRRPPRFWSSSCLISSSSFLDVSAPARTCMTSAAADPSKTRSIRSATSRRLVCCSRRAGA